MDGKTIGHKLRALRGEMDAKTVADALESALRRFLCMSAANAFPATRSKAHCSVFRPECRRNFSQNEHILCAIQKEVKSMKIKIIGEPKEIAALVLAVQGRQNREVLAIGEISAKGHSNDLVTKDSQNREIHNGTCGFQTSIL